MALSRREGKKTLYNGMPRCSFYLGFVLYAMEGVLRFRCWCELQEEMLRLRCNLQPTVLDAPRTYRNSRPPGRLASRYILIIPPRYLRGTPFALPGFCTAQVQLVENSGNPRLHIVNASLCMSQTIRVCKATHQALYPCFVVCPRSDHDSLSDLPQLVPQVVVASSPKSTYGKAIAIPS
jgi:hypothetical protein